MWTFVYTNMPVDIALGVSDWKESAQRFPELNQAVHAASEWLEVCYLNGWPVAVAVEKIEESPQDTFSAVHSEYLPKRGRMEG
jgi:hypothetical protein